MRYIVAFVLCLAVVSARRGDGHRRRQGHRNNNADNNNSNDQGTQAQVQEGRWFSVQPDSSYWSRTVFRLKDSNVNDCERKCVSYKGGCMSFDFHKRTGTCYGRPEGAQIFEDRDQRDRIHHSNHYNFYYISQDDLINAQYQWENESPTEAAAVAEEENRQSEEERERQEEEQERERARQRHQEMLAERQRRIEFRKQQEAERQRQNEANRQRQPQNNNRFTQPEAEIIEVPVEPVVAGGSYVHDPDFTCLSGVKSYATGRLMSDTTELERCEVRSYSTPHRCYQLSLEMTMRTGGIEVQTSSYTGGCFYPEMKEYLNKGRDAAAESLPEDMTLDFYSFATCNTKNCFDLTESVESDEQDDKDGFEPGFLCPLHGCTPDRIGCRGNLKTDDNGCTLCECEEEEHVCEHNQVWNECGTACPLRCGEEVPAFCTYNCVIGCACPDGLWLTEEGQCVREQECPELYPELYPDVPCPLHGCTPDRIGCYPGSQLKQDNNGCTLCECEDPPVEECPHNQVFMECGTACPLKCGEPEPFICTANCVRGCACGNGLWMTEDGYCVDQQDCPAAADDNSSPEECYEAVGMEDGSLGDDQISSSSAYWGYPAHYARLNGNNAWAPQLTKAGEYLEIDFGKRINVVGVSTQGKKYYFQDTYITKYNLEYMDRRDNWVSYNNQQEFDGNEDADTPRSNFFFDYPIHTRKLRFVINDWEQQILMRAEVYQGC